MWNAIDPNIIIDENGTPWMNFGSFWDGIKMVKLTPDMNGVAQPEEWYSLLAVNVPLIWMKRMQVMEQLKRRLS